MFVLKSVLWKFLKFRTSEHKNNLFFLNRPVQFSIFLNDWQLCIFTTRENQFLQDNSLKVFWVYLRISVFLLKIIKFEFEKDLNLIRCWTQGHLISKLRYEFVLLAFFGCDLKYSNSTISIVFLLIPKWWSINDVTQFQTTFEPHGAAPVAIFINAKTLSCITYTSFFITAFRLQKQGG